MSVVGLERAVLFRLATSERLERAVKTLPFGEAAAWRAASRYVAGPSRGQALATATTLLERGHAVSVDLFGERVSDPAAADRVLEEYVELAGALPPPASEVWLSVDLTHLALDTDAVAVADRLAAIARALPAGGRVQVGAEDAARSDAIVACVLDVAARGLADRLGATVQANLRRSPADADALARAGVHVRLVKGAYVEATGAHPYGEATDVAFLRLGFRLAERDLVDGHPRRSTPRGAAPRSRTPAGRAAARSTPRDPRRAAHPRHPDPGLRPLRPRLVPLLAAPGRRVPRRLTTRRRRARAIFLYDWVAAVRTYHLT
jgi:proline dehydrogenase